MFITHTDAQLYTVAFGGGPRTLLALGGWVGSWDLWAETFSVLSRSWRTVAFDHRGCGATIAPIESISLPLMVADVLAVMDALAIDQCVLAAESAGVAVALQAALTAPERFTGLICVAGMYHRAMPVDGDPFVSSLRTAYLATLQRFVDACLSDTDSIALRRWGMQVVARAEQAAAIRLYESLAGLDLRPQVSQIRQPTLILHGSADNIQPLAESEWLAAHIPQSHLTILAGAGHVPTVTRAHEVADAINTFHVGESRAQSAALQQLIALGRSIEPYVWGVVGSEAAHNTPNKAQSLCSSL
ncbi:alpha/beta hydrolase [Candidatus Gracilibacteria bacterium]|nr:alpha/beta hydrolase [Candidatus Gracilibacteria bacterium]